MNCSKCILDETAKEIVFDSEGVCNFCRQAEKSLNEIKREAYNLRTFVNKIKQDGKKYDCLIGLSGGVDSSMVLHYAVQLGLNPLCFSFNNGWNEPNADANVKALVDRLGVDWVEEKIDAVKYKELQMAFLQGGIRNIEATTDHILFAITYEMAVKNGIKWILSGGNTATESIMPASWGEDARDLYWIKSVYKRITGKKLKGLPTISLLREQYYRLFKRIKFFRLLDYFNYNRDESIELLQREYGYKPYGEKHCESKFTWWFQNHYLYKKWGIDKRKAHLSSLINSGQITRDEALKVISKEPEYPELDFDLTYPKKEYNDYPNSRRIRQFVVLLYKIKKLWT